MHDIELGCDRLNRVELHCGLLPCRQRISASMPHDQHHLRCSSTPLMLHVQSRVPLLQRRPLLDTCCAVPAACQAGGAAGGHGRAKIPHELHSTRSTVKPASITQSSRMLEAFQHTQYSVAKASDAVQHRQYAAATHQAGLTTCLLFCLAHITCNTNSNTNSRFPLI